MKPVNMFSLHQLTYLILTCVICESAKILGVFPAPVYSHQLVFRPFIKELVKRGHEVTVVTAFPMKSIDYSPENLKEIPIQKAIEAIRMQCLNEDLKDANDMVSQQKVAFKTIYNVFDRLLGNELKEFVRSDQKFDVIIAEAVVRLNLVFSHIFKAPLIQMSSFGGVFDTFEMVGGSTHPLLYPLGVREKFKNLTMLDKIEEVYRHYELVEVFNGREKPEDEMLKGHLGSNFPNLSELKDNVAMVFLNVHSIWDSNRPVPPNVVYLGGLHLQKEKELPKDIKAKLDASSNGAIYMSFGSTISSSIFNTEKLDMFLRAVSKLPYTVFWKWDADVTNVPNNVVVQKWFPQADLLKHPNVKLFITQGGLQSTDEAIDAGVPIVGVPILWDQWLNVDKIVELKIGVMCNIRNVTEGSFREAVETVVSDKSYKQNIDKLRDIIRDQPQTSLERAVWWTEYVIRHNGAKHLRSPAFDMSVIDYYEIKILLLLVLVLVILIVIIVKLCLKLVSILKPKVKSD